MIDLHFENNSNKLENAFFSYQNQHTQINNQENYVNEHIFNILFWFSTCLEEI